MLLGEMGEHHGCLMAWPYDDSIWGGYLPQVQTEIADIAAAITKFEPVVMLVPIDRAEQAIALQKVQTNVRLVPFAYNDLWVRDTGPLWLNDDRAVTPRFNGWGRETLENGAPLPYELDARLAEAIGEKVGLTISDAGLVLEGGVLETDGNGTLLVTETNLRHQDRNPGLDRGAIEDRLKARLGVRKVIWMPGSKLDTFTDGHADGIARFVNSSTLVVDEPISAAEKLEAQANCSVLSSSTNAAGDSLSLTHIRASRMPTGEIACNSYINFYLCGAKGAKPGLIVPSFGDGTPDSDNSEADIAASMTLKKLYPDRDVIPVRIGELARAGGGIHCATRELPAWWHSFSDRFLRDAIR